MARKGIIKRARENDLLTPDLLPNVAHDARMEDITAMKKAKSERMRSHSKKSIMLVPDDIRLADSGSKRPPVMRTQTMSKFFKPGLPVKTQSRQQSIERMELSESAESDLMQIKEESISISTETQRESTLTGMPSGFSHTIFTGTERS